MKKLGLIFLALNTCASFAQDYFQQQVDYKIEVTLNDEEHTLSGFETFDYKNNSTDELGFIYIHLWPNAYKNNKTALGKQLNWMGNEELEFATEEELGAIDSLDFKVNGSTVEWMYDEEHIDICKLILSQPLKPGETIAVSTPFKVKIPSGSISRLGHIGESYQITQWYPKPAVYDKNGWNQMPYLTQGEFYSEYGTFDVSITLPKNYVVGATGDLQTASEIAFLDERAKQTQNKYDTEVFSDKKRGDDEFPESDKEMKTIRYTQKDVHDFAFFADKRFEVLKGEVALPGSGEMVTSWAMFVGNHSHTWEDAIEYLNDAIFYYSKWNGDYPYKQVTAVDGTISAGGGMEYPNVTVIGTSGSKEELEVVIVHEVGHNWFYGLLGSNEREHAWMDEGLNTLNEIRYMQTKYPDNQRLSDMAGGIADKIHLENLNHHDMSDLTYSLVAGYGLDQPIELTSDDFRSINYGAIVYAKTGLVFTYLKDYLGDELFDKAMRSYYDKWHYKHPQPEDLKHILEKETNKDLSWIFEDLIQTTQQIDFKMKKVKVNGSETVVTVKNTGQVNSPVRVDAYSLGQLRESKWIEPGESKKQSVVFNGTSYDQFVIDANKQMPEVNRNNNYWSKKGIFHRTEPFKMEFFAGDNEGNKWNNFWLPAMGINAYDQFMLGAMFHNQTIAKHPFEYTITPLFSFGRRSVSGLVNLNYSWVPRKNVRMVTLGLEGKSFGQGLPLTASDHERPKEYYVVRPYLDIKIGKSARRSPINQRLKLMGHYIFETGFVQKSREGGSLEYGFSYTKGRHGFDSKVRLDYLNGRIESVLGISSFSVMNAGVELTYELEYWKRKGKSIQFRGFFGQNLLYEGIQQGRYGFYLGGQSGTADVTYESFFFGRNESSGFWANQRLENQGGFKTTSNFGNSTDMLAAFNVYTEIPYVPLVGAFADYGVFDNNGETVSAVNIGLGVKFNSIFGVYFPLYESDNLKASFPDGTRYGEKIRFTLNLNGFNLKDRAPEIIGN